MHRVLTIVLQGYREWTESLGPDREHVIQRFQGEWHRALWSSFSDVGAVVHQLRYDVALGIANNVEPSSINNAFEKIRDIPPVTPEIYIRCGEDPLTAHVRGYECGDAEDSEVTALHVDYENFTALTDSTSPYTAFAKVIEIYGRLLSLCDKYRCLAFYLGGDNFAVFTPSINEARLLGSDLVELGMRVGIGIGRTPRKALTLATDALDRLRRGDEGGGLAVRYH